MAAHDYWVMQCPLFRAAVSARLDGEPLGMSESALDDHLATCPACMSWADAAARVTRRARLAPAPAVPDLTVAVLEALPRELPGAATAVRAQLVTTALRLALLAVGVAQAGLAWPALASGVGSMSAPVHMAHETGAWNLGVAVALVAVAAAPRLAAGTLAFLGSFVVFLTPVTLADLADGEVPLDRVLGHLFLLAGTVLVAVVAWRSRERRERRVGGARRRVPA